MLNSLLVSPHGKIVTQRENLVLKHCNFGRYPQDVSCDAPNNKSLVQMEKLGGFWLKWIYLYVIVIEALRMIAYKM